MKGGAVERQRRGKRRGRRVVAHGNRRTTIDAHKISRAIVALAQAKAEVEAQAAHETQIKTDPKGEGND